MNVLFVAHYSRFYGANRSLLQLILHLREEYGVCPFIVLPHEGPFIEELLKNDIPFSICKFHSWLTAPKKSIRSSIKRLMNIYYFNEIKKFFLQSEITFDLIHTNTSATELGHYLSLKMDIPHIWHLREYGVKDYGLKFTGGIRHAAKKMNSSDMVIAISNDIKTYYSNYVDSSKINVIYNGVYPPKHFQKSFNKEKKLKLVFIGNISETKNQLEAIRACEYLINEHKFLDFELHIIGEGTTQYIHEIKKYVTDKGLENYIKFVGYLPNVYNYLKTCDLGIVCSKSEAFGRVTIEYMMHSMPVIGSRSGANPELISNGETGYLYELGNYKELAEIIKRLNFDRGNLKSIGMQAYDHSLKHYSSLSNAKQIYEVYLKLIRI